MLDKLTAAEFLPLVGQAFLVNEPALPAEIQPFHLTLASVIEQAEEPLSRPAELAARRTFSLIFHGPLSPVLVQHIFPLEHPALGRLEIFLVPVGPQGQSMQYEAIFN